jgi:hypothetical protein
VRPIVIRRFMRTCSDSFQNQADKLLRALLHRNCIITTLIKRLVRAVRVWNCRNDIEIVRGIKIEESDGIVYHQSGQSVIDWYPDLKRASGSTFTRRSVPQFVRIRAWSDETERCSWNLREDRRSSHPAWKKARATEIQITVAGCDQTGRLARARSALH